MESMERRRFLSGLAALGGGALLTAVGCTPKKPGVFADGALSYIGGYMVAGAIMAEDGKTD